jgi:uncharacterized membrane protein
VAAVIEAPTCGLGGVSTIGTAINPSGTTVVGYRFCLGTAMPWKWTQAGGLVMLQLPPWLVEATPTDVNDNNIMVGTGVGPVAGHRGFLCHLESGIWTELLPQNPPTGWSSANAINNNNVVVGWRSVDDGGSPTQPQTAFRWVAAAGFVDLGVVNGFNTFATDINDAGTATGMMGVGQAGHGYLWYADGRLVDIGSVHELATVPTAINSRHEVTGRDLVDLQTTVNHAFVWSKGVMTDLLPLAGFARSSASGISASGLVIGQSVFLPSGGGGERGTLWWNHQAVDVNLLMSGVGGNPVVGLGDISNSGTLIGWRASDTVLLKPQLILADVDGNCVVDVDDLIAVILKWGERRSPADVNHDGIVDINDLILVIINWTS